MERVAAFVFVSLFWGWLATWNLLLVIPGVVLLAMIVRGDGWDEG